MLPLTVDEAVEHAGRFPLAVMFVPLRAKAKGFAQAQKLGIMLDRKTALRVMPVAYLPKDAPCPALDDDGLCRIHQTKPVRCRAMPFFAWRDEAEQADLLVPRPGWACDVTAAAPAVYDAGRVLDRAGFAAERAALESQAPILRAYAQRLLPMAVGLSATLATLAAKPGGGAAYVGFSTLLRRLAHVDKAQVARAQLPVLHAWVGRGDAGYGRDLAGFIAECERLAASGP